MVNKFNTPFLDTNNSSRKNYLGEKIKAFDLFVRKQKITKTHKLFFPQEV